MPARPCLLGSQLLPAGQRLGVVRETENDILHVVELCRVCSEACDRYVTRLAADGERDPRFLDTIRCIALLSMIADRLEEVDHAPVGLVDVTIELARELPNDEFGCAAACQAAADALSARLDSAYEHE
jgi:hypothetical protein